MLDPSNLYSLLERGGLLAGLVVLIVAIVVGFVMPRSSYLSIIALWELRYKDLQDYCTKLEARYAEMEAIASNTTTFNETVVEILEVLDAAPSRRQRRPIQVLRKGVRR